MTARAASIITRTHGIRGELRSSVNGSPFEIPMMLLPGGSVAVDGKSAARRKLSAKVVASHTSPTVSPISGEVQAWIVLVDDPSGREYEIPVGTFVLTDVKEDGNGSVTISGEDRWRRVQDARLPSPVTTSGSTITAITSLLRGADDRITVVVDPGVPTDATHQASTWDRDRDKAVTELATSIGCTVFFDPLGVAHISQLPSLDDDAYWTIGTGMGGARLGRARGISRERTYNAVVVTGDTAGQVPPVSAFVTDNDQLSPTRYGGPFGRRPRFYTSSLVTTQAQASDTASRMLASARGIARTLTVDALAHPGLDAWDVISVETDPGIYGRYLVGSFTLPLGLGSISIDALTGAETDDGGQ